MIIFIPHLARLLSRIITWLCVFWRESVVVAPDSGMWKATTPGVKQSRASQSMERACQPPSWRHCRCFSLWLCLNLRLIPHKKTIWYMVMVIDDSTYLFWYRHITLPALNGHTVLRAWRRYSRTQTLHDGVCKATTPVVKERCVTSQWMKVGDVARFGGDFWTYFVVNTFEISNGSWCMGIKGEMSGTVCVTFTWYMYIYELFITQTQTQTFYWTTMKSGFAKIQTYIITHT